MLGTLRSLTRAPWLSLAVVATLAIGVAAVTAIFGVVNAALFRQPPFPDAGRIALLYTERQEPGKAPYRERWSYPRIQLLRQSQQSFSDVANYSGTFITISGTDGAETANGELVSPSYFTVMRVGAARGRLLTAADDVPGSPAPVVVISDALWRRHFASDPAAVGRDLRINGSRLTVVGILPPNFAGLTGRAELWMPATLAPRLTYAEYLVTNQNFISVVGRLRAGVSLADAKSELAVLGAAYDRAIRNDDPVSGERVGATAMSLNEARVDPAIQRALLVLLAAVAVLHLLACANVVNLLLGRGAARRRESAVRLALGSSVALLFGHHALETVALCAAAGVTGTFAAWITLRTITPPANAWMGRNFYGAVARFDTPAFSGTELAFALALAVVTGIVVTLPTALAAVRLDVGSEIKSGSRGSSAGAISLRRPSLRGVVVGVEAALAMLLVVAAGLLIDSFQRMRRTPIGVDTSNLLTFWVVPGEVSIPPNGAAPFVTRMLEAMQRIPGVVSASVDGGAPLSGSANSMLQIVGRPPAQRGQEIGVLRHYVGVDHFRTLGIPIRRGRVFTAADDAGAPSVAVISETAARRFWPNQDPIGQRVWFPGGSAFNRPDSTVEIVGIVGDVKYAPLERHPTAVSFYTPYRQFTYASRTVFLKTTGNPYAVVADTRKALASVSPDVSMREVQTLEEVVYGSWARSRFDAMLFGGFGVAALLLAASGIFAVLAYAIANRTRELGIRIALGAQRGAVMRMVVREGLLYPAVGVVVGIAASLAAGRLLRASLYEVTPAEPRVFVTTTVLLLVSAVVASLVPAWRATRVDPVVALRAD